MSTKRKGMIAHRGSEKKQRKVIDLEMKMNIINYYEAGKKVKIISSDFGLAHSTVSTILKDKEKIKDAVRASTGFKATIIRQRKGLIHETEKLLAVWIDGQTQEKIPLSLLIIQAKARSIFNTLKEREGSAEAFSASNGWFQRFRRRFNLHNRCVSGEAARADGETVEKSVDLIELDALRHLKQEATEEEIDEEMHKEFTLEGLASVFAKVNAALFELAGMDQNVERFMAVERQMNELLMCYHEIYEEKITKQTTLTSFFTKAPTRTSTPTSLIIASSSSPLPGPSTAIDSDFGVDDLKPLPHKKD